MNALQDDHPGVPREALKLRELPLPEPGPGELRLRIAYAPIHPSDLNLIEGTYGTQEILPAITRHLQDLEELTCAAAQQPGISTSGS